MAIDKSMRDEPVSEQRGNSLTDLDAVFSDEDIPSGLRRVAPTLHKAASSFWSMALGAGALSPRMKELVLVALHGTVTAVDTEAVRRHIQRALNAGATELDVMDVMLTIAGVANHALYFSVPVLLRELQAMGHPESEPPPLSTEGQLIKDAFVRERGFWNEQRDILARMMPDYFGELSTLSTQSWKHGSLSRKERELVCVAIDCTVTHTFEPGLAIHIRNALREGATPEEILDVFKLASATGLEGYVLSAETLFGKAASKRRQDTTR
jgi:alkylhydroperoxidase/carboxymuconolactone decarboxylase family protein YurZ